MQEKHKDLSWELFDLKRLIEFRQWMHENAELSLVEFNTVAKIREYALSLGVAATDLVVCTKTGLTITLSGTGAAKGSKRMIGLRSDHDALPIKEDNPHLPYASKTNAAHMCGHDGHTTCLLGGLSFFMANRDKVPSDRSVRFIFQPAEEGFRGATMMIEEGVLEGVDEIYGCHNMPFTISKYEVLVSDKEMMAHMDIVRIKVHGKGGHGSAPEKCNNPIPIAARAYLLIMDRLSEYQKEHPLVRFSMTSFNGGNTFNVIPTTVEISGTLRTFEKEDSKMMVGFFSQALDAVTKQYGATYELDIEVSSEAVINTARFSQKVRQTAIELYGSEFVGTEGLPVYASEDFADFLQLVPGCLFFRVIHNNVPGTTLHSDKYNFDDGVIEDSSLFWFKLLQARLNDD